MGRNRRRLRIIQQRREKASGKARPRDKAVAAAPYGGDMKTRRKDEEMEGRRQEAKRDEPITLSDEALKKVNGGLNGSDRCPQCGSELSWLGNSIQMYACSNPNCDFVGA